MTCRERLNAEHPLHIDPGYIGGCMDCPSDYGYLPDPEYCPEGGSHDICVECWDRELTENDTFTTWRDFRNACDRGVYDSVEGYRCYRTGRLKPVACTFADCPRRPDPFAMEAKYDENVKEAETTMTNTKKTKAQLIEELKAATEHAADLENQLKDLEKYKQYEDAAAEIRAVYDAFIHAGFNETQAYDLLKMTWQLAVANNITDNVRNLRKEVQRR